MKKIATCFSFCLVITALLISQSASAQYSVDNPIVINSFPYTVTNVNTSDGVTASGMQGSCFTLPCCSVYVYKVTIPANGVLRVTMDNFVPLAGTMIAYYSNVSTPTSFSDLTYVSSTPGNFCGFRDTVQLGRGYNGWETGPIGNRSLVPSGLEAVYDFNNPNFNAGFFPAGDYYLLVFNENQQASQGIGVSTNLIFEFAEACSPLTAPSSLSFDPVEFNAQSDTTEFYVKNDRTVDVVLDLNSISISGTNASEFSLINIPTDSNLVIGDSVLIRVASSPTGPGSRVASLDIPFSDSVCSATTSVSLNGTGAEPEIKVLGNSVSINSNDSSPTTSDHTDFGVIVSNTGSIVREFSIVNEGNDTLELSATPLVSILGSTQFSVQSSPSANILPGDTANFSILFTPTMDGTHTAIINIANNDANESPFTFTIRGEGAARNALRFDGSNDYVAINNVATKMGGVTTWTAEMWINADNSQSGNDHMLAVNTTGSGNIMLLRLDDGILSFFDGSNSYLASGIDLRDDQWHHIAVSYNATSLKMYIDGSLYNTHSVGSISFATNHRWSLGQEFDGSSSRSEFFKGALNEVRIWKSVKTDQEITDNRYCEINNPESDTNLVAYYTANQGTAEGTNTSISALNDMSANGFDGTLTNFALTGSASNFISATNVGVNCNSISVKICDANTYSSPAGNTYTSSALYIDTISKSGGGDSIVYIDLKLNYNAYSQNTIADTSLCINDTLNGAKFSTNRTSTLNLVKANSDWVALDGVEDSLINTNRSVFMWMRAAGQISGTQQVLLGINTSGSGTVTNFGIATNEELWINDGGSNRNSGVVVTDGDWHFVGYTYNEVSNLTTFYVDGVAANTFTNGQSISAVSRVSIGQEFDSSTPSNFFDGEITEVSIWNELLDTTDIKQIMNAAIQNTHSKFDNLISYHPANALCSDGVKVLRDFSGNNLHGTLSSTSILNRDSLVTINSFDATDHFNFNVNHNGSSVSTANPFSFTYTSPGDYVATLSKDFFSLVDTFNITNGSSCTASIAVSIMVDSNVSCNGLSDGGLTAAVSGGTAPYSYLWSNGDTTLSLSGLSAGTYSVTVTDNNGISGMSSSTLNDPTVLNLSAAVDNNTSSVGANDGAATAMASGGTAPYSYLWNNTATTASITGVVAGTYTVTVTDNRGCTNSTTVTITDPVPPTIVISEISYNGPESGSDSTEFIEIYNYGNVALNLTGYSFTSGIVYTFPNVSIAADSYLVIAVDSVAIQNVFGTPARQWTGGGLSNGGEPIALKNSSGELIDSLRYDDNTPWPNEADGDGHTIVLCDHTSDNTDGSNWIKSGSLISGLLVNGKPVYGSPMSDDDGCVNSPSISGIVDSNVTCNGLSNGGATASASGGTAPYSFSWSNGATTASITGVAVGTYSITVTDSAGLTDSTSVTITEPAALMAFSVADSNVTCNSFSDGGATAGTSGGTPPYSYSWNNGATTASITGVAAGMYSVTITDANGCSDTSSVIITEPAALNAAVVIDSNASCSTFSDGGATASATGGTQPYTYLWSNSATTASITGVVAGTYSVTITDANGCTAINSGTVTQPVTMNISSVTTTNPSCNGASDGSAMVNVVGGTSPYTYSWNNGMSTATGNSSLSAGTYTLTVTDANGCTVQQSNVTITEPDGLGGGTISGKNP